MYKTMKILSEVKTKRRNGNGEDGGMARKKLGERNQEKKVRRREEILG